MKQQFTIPGRLDGVNEYTYTNRRNPIEGGKMKRRNQDAVCWAIKAAHLKPMGKVNVHVEWIEPNMRRDKDNIRGGIKFILDALVEMGILANDGWNQIGNLSDSYMVNKREPRIIVTLEEVNE